jgi:hypothetical protein
MSGVPSAELPSALCVAASPAALVGPSPCARAWAWALSDAASAAGETPPTTGGGHGRNLQPPVLVCTVRVRLALASAGAIPNCCT